MATPKTDKTYYTDFASIEARFIEEIEAIPNHGLLAHEIRAFAASITTCIKSRRGYTSSQGTPQMQTDSKLFNLRKKVAAALTRLKKHDIKEKDIVSLVKRQTAAALIDGETLALNLLGLAKILIDFRSTLVEPEPHKQWQIGDAIHHIGSTDWGCLMIRSPETLSLYRRYIHLVSQGKIRHDAFLKTDGKSGRSIPAMTKKLVEERLADYDARRKRAEQANPDTVVVTPEPTRTDTTAAEARKTAAAQIAALHNSRRPQHG